MERTPSFLLRSSAQPLPVFSASLCSLLLPPALFASKLWIYLVTIRYAARSPETELRGTTTCGTSCSSSLIPASSRPSWRSWVSLVQLTSPVVDPETFPSKTGVSIAASQLMSLSFTLSLLLTSTPQNHVSRLQRLRRLIDTPPR